MTQVFLSCDGHTVHGSHGSHPHVSNQTQDPQDSQVWCFLPVRQGRSSSINPDLQMWKRNKVAHHPTVICTIDPASRSHTSVNQFHECASGGRHFTRRVKKTQFKAGKNKTHNDFTIAKGASKSGTHKLTCTKKNTKTKLNKKGNSITISPSLKPTKRTSRIVLDRCQTNVLAPVTMPSRIIVSIARMALRVTAINNNTPRSSHPNCHLAIKKFEDQIKDVLKTHIMPQGGIEPSHTQRKINCKTKESHQHRIIGTMSHDTSHVLKNTDPIDLAELFRKRFKVTNDEPNITTLTNKLLVLLCEDEIMNQDDKNLHLKGERVCTPMKHQKHFKKNKNKGKKCDLEDKSKDNEKFDVNHWCTCKLHPHQHKHSHCFMAKTITKTQPKTST